MLKRRTPVGEAGCAACECRQNLKQLPSVLGWPGVMLFTVGGTIGSAIFRVPSEIATHAGSAAAMTALWLIGSVLALCLGFVFIELAVRIPRSGGVVVYLKEAFGRGPAFVYGWTMLFLAFPAGIAGVARAFADYAGTMVQTSESALRLVAASVVAFHTLAALRSTRFAAGFTSIGGVGKIFGILLVLAVSFSFQQGSGAASANTMTVPIFSLVGVALGLVPIIFAFDGNFAATFLTAEVRKPERNMPLGILWGTLIIGLLYVSLSSAYVHVLGISGVRSSTAVAADTMQAVLGERGLVVMSTLVMTSAFITVGAMILSFSRNTYAMSQDGVFFRCFADIHPSWETPWLSVLIMGTIAIVLLFFGSYGFLFRLYVFVAYPLIALAALATVRLRRRDGLPRDYRMPLYPWPVAAVAGLIVLVLVFGAFADPAMAFYGPVVMLVGTFAYYGWRRTLG